jgi:hypothetical protein
LRISGSPVAGNGNIPNHRYAQKRFHVWVMRQRLEWVPEENKEINAAFSDAGADLLVAAKRAALESGDFSCRALFPRLCQLCPLRKARA